MCRIIFKSIVILVYLFLLFSSFVVLIDAPNEQYGYMLPVMTTLFFLKRLLNPLFKWVRSINYFELLLPLILIYMYYGILYEERWLVYGLLFISVSTTIVLYFLRKINSERKEAVLEFFKNEVGGTLEEILFYVATKSRAGR